MEDITSNFNSGTQNTLNIKKSHKLDLDISQTKAQKSSFTIKSYVDLDK